MAEKGKVKKALRWRVKLATQSWGRRAARGCQDRTKERRKKREFGLLRKYILIWVVLLVIFNLRRYWTVIRAFTSSWWRYALCSSRCSLSAPPLPRTPGGQTVIGYKPSIHPVLAFLAALGVINPRSGVPSGAHWETPETDRGRHSRFGSNPSRSFSTMYTNSEGIYSSGNCMWQYRFWRQYPLLISLKDHYKK